MNALAEPPLAGLRVLLIEDMASLRMVYRSILIHAGAEVRVAATAAEGRAQFRDRPAPVVLLDLALPDGDGLDLMRDLRAMRADLRIVVITAHGGVGRAVQAMRAGAHDFLVKPFDEVQLLAATRSAAQSLAAPGRRPRALAEGLGAMVGSSRAMAGVAIAIASAAPAMAPVLVTGARGTGKALCARMLHALSGRAEGPFQMLDCRTAAPDQVQMRLIASAEPGKAASESTLYLANLPDLPLDQQRRLLSILQQEVRMAGQDRPRAGPVRLIAGSAEPPEAAMAQGRLDPGLFHMFQTLRIDLPPLSERGRDVVEIARAALNHYAAQTGKSFLGLSAPVEELLGQISWPGNVAELLKLVRQLVLVQPGGLVTLDMLPAGLVPGLLRHVERPAETPEQRATNAPSREEALQALRGLTLAQVERALIEDRIAAVGGSLPRAAKALGLSPSTLYRKREAWDDPGGA